MRTRHAAVQAQALGLAGQCLDMARQRVVGFVAVHVHVHELAALITALHRTAQRRLPVTLIGAGLPQLRGRMGRAKSYAERLFDFPEIGALAPTQAEIAIVKPLAALHVAIKPAGLRRIKLIAKGMIWSPNHGDTAFTVPLFDQFMRRIMPGEDWQTR